MNVDVLIFGIGPLRNEKQHFCFWVPKWGLSASAKAKSCPPRKLFLLFLLFFAPPIGQGFPSATRQAFQSEDGLVLSMAGTES